MDILTLIKNQVEEAIALNSKTVGLESVITHISRAEHYLNLAKKTNDEHLYTDIIYRTNHAFEGILKEAYTILAAKEAANTTPYAIENYLVDNNILNNRVVELLKNYRQEWRNTSTHDYNLFFNDSEAFLAIVSVSAFVHVLMNQILSKIYFDLEKDKIKTELGKLKKKIKDYETLSFVDKIGAIIQSFKAEKDYSEGDKSNGFMHLSREIIASLSAYITSIDKNIKIQIEPSITVADKRLRPDLVVENEKGEKIIIELKIARRSFKMYKRQLFDSQLLSYLVYTNIPNGILFFVPTDMNTTTEFETEKSLVKAGGIEFSMIKIFSPDVDAEDERTT